MTAIVLVRGSCPAAAVPMQAGMLLRFSLVLVPALALAAVDLAVKTAMTTDDWDFHQRSHAWSVVAVVLLAVLLLLAVLPSRLVAAAAGVVAGGVLGNLLSAYANGGRVPNPIVLGPLASNLADAFVLVGAPLLVVASRASRSGTAT